MAVIHHDHPALSDREQKVCAVKFALTWLGFFAVIGVVTWIGSAL
jgi:hypothetical protein